ncbi:MAG: BREX protein BrxB domain-containing protein [Syntrophales bacterium]
MSDWKTRLKEVLEPTLALADPRPKMSAYHDMPYAIFLYPPEDEFVLRKEVSLLKTRLEQAGKRITIISLSECLWEGLGAEISLPEFIEAERGMGTDKAIETAHEIISVNQPLPDLVAKRIPTDATPIKDIAFIMRAGALFPIYRTSALLEKLQGKVFIPAILFYPGIMDGPTGLRFMGILEAEHNYRPKIF